MSLSEEFLNDFRFSFLVVFIKKKFIVLEITLSFVMIASFSTDFSSAILLELDPLLPKYGFADFQKLLLSVTRYQVCHEHLYFFDFLRRFWQ